MLCSSNDVDFEVDIFKVDVLIYKTLYFHICYRNNVKIALLCLPLDLDI